MAMKTAIEVMIPGSGRARPAPTEDEDHLDVEGDEEEGVRCNRDPEPAVGVAVGSDGPLS